MVTTGLLISLAINVVVGAYFLWLFPRSVRKNFPTGIPPGFAILSRILPTAGVILIFGSLLFGILALAGAFGK